MGLAFGVIFLITLLIIACIVLGILAKQKLHRLAFFAAAGLLVVVTAAGCWVTLSMNEETPPQPIASEADPSAEKKNGPPKNAKGSGVVLVIDESTITKDQDEENAAPLEIEKTPVVNADDPPRKKERQRLSHQLRAVEQALKNSTGRLRSQMAAIDQQFHAKQISNYEALFQKSTLMVKQEELVITAMEKKLQLLKAVTQLTAQDTAPDIERVEKRLSRAQEKRGEYQGVLKQLASNSEVFKDL